MSRLLEKSRIDRPSWSLSGLGPGTRALIGNFCMLQGGTKSYPADQNLLQT